MEGEKTSVYSANALNQYTRIVEDDESLFLPEFDADGNQTRVQTSTGSWAISYNNENRPTDFTAQDAQGNFMTVHCSYDYMGRRSYKKVISGGEVVLYQRYIYRGYLQIAYTYSPYGSVTATGNVTQPIQWSSEVMDEELGLVYYNYRYYNAQNGKWINRDFLNKKICSFFRQIVLLLILTI